MSFSKTDLIKLEVFHECLNLLQTSDIQDVRKEILSSVKFFTLACEELIRKKDYYLSFRIKFFSDFTGIYKKSRSKKCEEIKNFISQERARLENPDKWVGKPDTELFIKVLNSLDVLADNCSSFLLVALQMETDNLTGSLTVMQTKISAFQEVADQLDSDEDNDSALMHDKHKAVTDYVIAKINALHGDKASGFLMPLIRGTSTAADYVF